MPKFTEEETSHIVDVGWTKVHYNEVGSGYPVVLLHGGGLGASSWSNFVMNIDPLADQFRVIAVDAPGFGKSGPIVLKDEARSTVFARAVKGVLDSLGIEKAHLIGNSMGGASALTFAVDYPERADKIVMMGAAPIGQRLMFTAMLPTDGIRALMHVYADPSFESFRTMFDMMVYDKTSVPDDTLKLRAASVNEEHRKNYLESQRNLAGVSRDIMAELPKVNSQVLLIHGSNDTMSPLENSLSLLPYLKKAEMHIFNQCGHWAQYEHAGRFNALVLDFLNN
jgi:2-hydroxy-6-oxonona-2,4-dienedioate hydrolase/2,6-dioxo-6-phenylhexa-3-enoate hydrolase